MADASTYCYGAHVRANGIRQHYYRYGGRGAPLILVPGIVSPAALWMHVAERLGRHFDTYLVDVRGRGLSEQGAHLDYGLDACADDLAAFIESLGLQEAVVVGHSMGARIGLRLAARPNAPALRHLVLLDPPASGPGRRAYPIPMERSQRMVEAAQRGEGDAYLRAPGVAPWPEPLLRQRAEWLATCDVAVIATAYRDFHEQDPYRDLAGAACPATLVVAGGSGVIRPEDVSDFQAAAPHLSVHVVADAAHQFQAENQAAFFDALAEVLAIPNLSE